MDWSLKEVIKRTTCFRCIFDMNCTTFLGNISDWICDIDDRRR